MKITNTFFKTDSSKLSWGQIFCPSIQCLTKIKRLHIIICTFNLAYYIRITHLMNLFLYPHFEDIAKLTKLSLLSSIFPQWEEGNIIPSQVSVTSLPKYDSLYLITFRYTTFRIFAKLVGLTIAL